MSDWQDISTAPKDGKTPVRLKSGTHAPSEAFFWSKRNKRWETEVFAVAGRVRGYWSENVEQPAQWKAASPAQEG